MNRIHQSDREIREVPGRGSRYHGLNHERPVAAASGVTQAGHDGCLCMCVGGRVVEIAFEAMWLRSLGPGQLLVTGGGCGTIRKDDAMGKWPRTMVLAPTISTVTEP